MASFELHHFSSLISALNVSRSRKGRSQVAFLVGLFLCFPTHVRNFPLSSVCYRTLHSRSSTSVQSADLYRGIWFEFKTLHSAPTNDERSCTCFSSGTAQLHTLSKSALRFADSHSRTTRIRSARDHVSRNALGSLIAKRKKKQQQHTCNRKHTRARRGSGKCV